MEVERRPQGPAPAWVSHLTYIKHDGNQVASNTTGFLFLGCRQARILVYIKGMRGEWHATHQRVAD